MASDTTTGWRQLVGIGATIWARLRSWYPWSLIGALAVAVLLVWLLTARTYDLFKDFAGPVATMTAAIVAVFVTYRLGRGQLDTAELQARLATVRLKHDLFDRRYEIYEVVFVFLIEIIKTRNITEGGMSTFVRGTQKAVFLYDQETVDYFENLRKQAVALQGQNALLSDQHNPVGPDRSKAAARAEDLFTWFNDQLTVLVERMKPFMVLDVPVGRIRPGSPATGERQSTPPAAV
jgi:hypothetical protein